MKKTFYFLFLSLLICTNLQQAQASDAKLKKSVENVNKALKEIKTIGRECTSCEASGVLSPPPSQFSAEEVDESKFVVVSAPVGSTGRSQLNIYEQVLDQSKCVKGKHCLCYRTNPDNGVVTPILGRTDPEAPELGVFDFTGKCRRYLDANGFMARIGNEDLSSHSLRVISRDGLNVLVATQGNQEIEIGKTQTSSSDFLKINLNSGWHLKRRTFNGKALGFIYLYHD